jgi:hypothetical protein
MYALVYVGKPPASIPRGWHLRTQIGRLDNGVLNAVLRADSVAELEIVKERQRARAWFKEDGPAWLKKYLHVESLEGTDVVRISFSYGSPKDQVAVINAVAKAYLDVLIDRERKSLRVAIASAKKNRAESLRLISSRQDDIAAIQKEKIEDERDAERIGKAVQCCRREIAREQNVVKMLDGSIRQSEERLRKPSIFLIEPAEVPESP